MRVLGAFFLEPGACGGDGKKLVVANADLNPDRRRHASGRQARSRCVPKLMRNLATREEPNGGALAGVVEGSFPAPPPRPRQLVPQPESMISGKSSEHLAGD